MLLDDIADYLSSGGGWTIGADLIKAQMLPGPDEMTAIFETGGFGAEHAMTNVAGEAPAENASIEVICRAATYERARANAQKAFLLLDGMPTRSINGVVYKYGKARQLPMGAGRDDQNRSLVTFNVDIIKALSSTS